MEDMEGLCPDRAAQGVSPIFRASLVQTSAALRPFRFGFACTARVGDYVFDISQTNGVDLPEIHEVSGDPGENVDRLAAFLKAQGSFIAHEWGPTLSDLFVRLIESIVSNVDP